MRGKVFFASSILDNLRITPAYAGKSTGRQRPPAIAWDHPRVCGEKQIWDCQQGGEKGSPPRMRGKETCRMPARAASRITPAYAGKSSSYPCPRPAPEDHPRVCGEKYMGEVENPHQAGSPPRMRGKDKWRCIMGDSSRITPAYAGKRWPAGHMVWAFGDHPRVCGEKTKKIP